MRRLLPGGPTVSDGKERVLLEYERMAREYLEEVERIDRRLEQLRQANYAHREADLWVRIGTLMEIRDDLQVTAHVLQRRAVGLL